MPRSLDATAGWDWFGAEAPVDPDPDGGETWQALAETAARCFRGDDGRRLLGHLRRATIERVLAPDVSEARLRHLEGQRQLVRHLEALIAAGRTGARSHPTQEEPIHD